MNSVGFHNDYLNNTGDWNSGYHNRFTFHNDYLNWAKKLMLLQLLYLHFKMTT